MRFFQLVFRYRLIDRLLLLIENILDFVIIRVVEFLLLLNNLVSSFELISPVKV